MLEGRVTRSGEPVVPSQLILRKRFTTFPAVIDTGFNGHLCVPRRLLAGSRWQVVGTEQFEVATGAVVKQEIYVGEAIFAGRRGLVYPRTRGPRAMPVGEWPSVRGSAPRVSVEGTPYLFSGATRLRVGLHTVATEAHDILIGTKLLRGHALTSTLLTKLWNNHTL